MDVSTDVQLEVAMWETVDVDRLFRSSDIMSHDIGRIRALVCISTPISRLQ